MDPYERLTAINESMLKRSVSAVKGGMQRVARNVGTNRAMYKQGGLFDAAAGVENKKNLANAIRSFSPRSSVNFTKAKPAGQNPVGPRTMRNVVLARTTSRIAGKRLGRKLAGVADKASVGGKAVSGAVQSAVGAVKGMRAARRKKRAIANFEKQLRDLPADPLDLDEESTEKIDQEFGAAKKALKDAGVEHDALQAIGSLDREKNTFKISKENMRKAREVLKKFPNAQIKRS